MREANELSRLATPHNLLMTSEPNKEFNALKIACIMDQFTYRSFEPECELVQLTPSGWLAQITELQPDLLLVESAWRGDRDLWTNKVAERSPELRDVIDWCRSRSVPTVFWNKEDPVHFTTFLTTSSLFDYVFTTDIDCIHRYKHTLGHNRVYLLPFASQPRMFDPIEIGHRIDAFAFAGAYYTRYPERARDLRSMIDHFTALKPFIIWDRNAESDDPRYSFPSEYAPFILGSLPYDNVQHAYKGYRFTVNLNSVKHSQTMCARRVYELLSSNSIIVSNFARSLRLLFGDLIISSDDPSFITQQISMMEDDPSVPERFRLAGLRKTLREHTYGDRLAYIWSKVSGQVSQNRLPEVLVVAEAEDGPTANRVIAAFQGQTHPRKRLLLAMARSSPEVLNGSDSEMRISTPGQLGSFSTADCEFVAGFAADDYYGPNYLTDLVLATRFSTAKVIGKATFARAREDGSIETVNLGQTYRRVRSLAARRSIVSCDQLDGEQIRDWLARLPSLEITHDGALSIDEFNYCERAAEVDRVVLAGRVDDIPLLDEGMPVAELQEIAETIPPAVEDDEVNAISPAELARWFDQGVPDWLSLDSSQNSLSVKSTLGERHSYMWSKQSRPVSDIITEPHRTVFFDVSPGLDVRLALRYLDEENNQLGSTVVGANENQETAPPDGTRWVTPGIRVAGSGTAQINGIALGPRSLEPPVIIGRGEHLLLTDHYPSHDDLYRNAFVHRRVVSYQDLGIDIDVFRLRSNAKLSFHEFDGVDCITGSERALRHMLEGDRYRSILVHFLSEEMWQTIEPFADHVPVNVWVHGSEIQPWHRRAFNFHTEREVESAKEQSRHRVAFWRRLLENRPQGLKLIFVSQYFADEVKEDLNLDLSPDSYKVIHNPIDTDLFTYAPKPVDQRLRILSIRPFASHKYANDLTVKAIMALTKESWFQELDIRIIGEGRLFDDTLEPLRTLPNVFLEERFLHQKEIADLHRDYGVFLCPTRMDAQGVSRDEAMSSGLVPITNAVAAIPEFVDETCGILAPPEDHLAMAAGIARIVEDPALFQAMSAAAAERVRSQSSHAMITAQEVAIFHTSART